MSDTPIVSADWLEAHLDDPNVRILEISHENDTATYRAGHIPGASWVFWQDIAWHETDRQLVTPEAMARRFGAIGIHPDTTLVLYGDPVQYGTYAFWAFTMAGHADLRLLDGTREKWVKENRPLSTNIPSFAQVDYPTPAPGDCSMRLGREAVRERLGNPDVLILDGRTPEEYAGISVGGRAIPGHGAQRFGRIPGAKHLFFRNFFNEDYSFKTADEIRAMLKSVAENAENAKEIICYCRLSHRATLLWTCLHHIAGFENIKIYDGSWTEWGSIVGFPVEK